MNPAITRLLRNFFSPFVAMLIAILTACLSPCVTLHGEYPERYVNVIIHYPAGGSTDLMTRLVTKHLSNSLKVPFVIKNYVGAGGQVGYFNLATAKPDGYTIGTITTTGIVTHELTRTNVPYRFRESFIPVAQIVNDPAGLFVTEDSPFHSLEDFIRYAKENPGVISLGGTSLWGSHHVHAKLIEREAGVVLNYIPFDGGSEARNNLLGKHVAAVSSGIAEYTSFIEAGKVRALAVAGESRFPNLPEVPTYRDGGYNIVCGSKRGFAVPAGTPLSVVERLSKMIESLMGDDEFLADAEKMKLKPILEYQNSAGFKNGLNSVYDEMVEMVGADHVERK